MARLVVGRGGRGSRLKGKRKMDGEMRPHPCRSLCRRSWVSGVSVFVSGGRRHAGPGPSRGRGWRPLWLAAQAACALDGSLTRRIPLHDTPVPGHCLQLSLPPQITGPASSPEYRDSLPFPDKYRKFAPGCGARCTLVLRCFAEIVLEPPHALGHRRRPRHDAGRNLQASPERLWQ